MFVFMQSHVVCAEAVNVSVIALWFLVNVPIENELAFSSHSQTRFERVCILEVTGF